MAPEAALSCVAGPADLTLSQCQLTGDMHASHVEMLCGINTITTIIICTNLCTLQVHSHGHEYNILNTCTHITIIIHVLVHTTNFLAAVQWKS